MRARAADRLVRPRSPSPQMRQWRRAPPASDELHASSILRPLTLDQIATPADDTPFGVGRPAPRVAQGNPISTSVSPFAALETANLAPFASANSLARTSSGPVHGAAAAPSRCQPQSSPAVPSGGFDSGPASRKRNTT